MSLNLRMDAVVKQKKRQMFPREHSKDHEGIGWYRHIANSTLDASNRPHFLEHLGTHCSRLL
jgi:hypothetical protein